MSDGRRDGVREGQEREERGGREGERETSSSSIP